MLRIELHAFIYRLQKKFLKNIEICDLWKVLKSPLSATGTPLNWKPMLMQKTRPKMLIETTVITTNESVFEHTETTLLHNSWS